MKLWGNRNLYIYIGFFLAAIVFLLLTDHNPQSSDESKPGKIDRKALVTRHNPVLTQPNKLSPLSVGNGEFAFTADITGLQTFPEFYTREESAAPAPGPDGFQSNSELEGSTPLVTQSQWGWHSFPNPEEFKMSDAKASYDANGKIVPYASRQHTPSGDWLRQNPHRLNLARIGFELKKEDGTAVQLNELSNIRQELDMWSGTLNSQFEIEGKPVIVQTRVHPEYDQLSVWVDASSLTNEQVKVNIEFPYGRGVHVGDPSDWSRPDRHLTQQIESGSQHIVWQRILDEDEYFVDLSWNASARVSNTEKHQYQLSFSDVAEPLSFSVAFSDEPFSNEVPKPNHAKVANENYWQKFWTDGGAIDLSKSSDPRAHELERRIVLSQYLTAIQSTGTQPPQETGLTYNSWYGKFHLEMHWWHGVHFALWDRLPLFEKSLEWYSKIIDKAKQATESQGYEGVRWPKMVSPDGRDSPSTIGVFLIWQQPHPIYYSELIYREKSTPETLEKYKDIVFETADFMASYPSWIKEKSEYQLGPPLIPAQEIFPPEETFNSGFELAYWKLGLETAQKWKKRLGMERDSTWQHILDNLPPIPEKNGLYVNAESAPNTFLDPEQRRDHPTLLASCGFLPCVHADREKMRQTLHKVMESWNWNHTWGWDYPLVAMTAARVGEPELAIEALMMDVQKNTYLPNGHNYQDSNLTLYLPGNGGLLTAVAMMAAGWDDAPDIDTPGFPQDGSWVVQWEDLKPFP
ncbi:hypothetical protein [Rhodohalobacter sp. 614A]|uniref:hypothetical protein n=1 Tax=Rhodohalobacter sp. 614A TaxID=2908649 RepID=UPI001F25F13C|nr:hypothetical protein [Rhodohalobacter sp. 614A]